MQVNYTVQNDKIFIDTPYELKDALRAFFKTAKFEYSSKQWTIKHNAGNLSKLSRFITSTEVISTLNTLNDCEAGTVTEAELQNLQRQNRMLFSAKKFFKENEANDVQSLERQLEETRVLRDKISAQVHKLATRTISSKAHDSFDAMLAPYTLNERTVIEVLQSAISKAQVLTLSKCSSETDNDEEEELTNMGVELVTEIEWLKSVQKNCYELYRVSFALLSHPLEILHGRRETYLAEHIRAWLYRTALVTFNTGESEVVLCKEPRADGVTFNTGESEEIWLERKLVELSLKSVTQTEAPKKRFKI